MMNLIFYHLLLINQKPLRNTLKICIFQAKEEVYSKKINNNILIKKIYKKTV